MKRDDCDIGHFTGESRPRGGNGLATEGHAGATRGPDSAPRPAPKGLLPSPAAVALSALVAIGSPGFSHLLQVMVTCWDHRRSFQITGGLGSPPSEPVCWVWSAA